MDVSASNASQHIFPQSILTISDTKERVKQMKDYLVKEKKHVDAMQRQLQSSGDPIPFDPSTTKEYDSGDSDVRVRPRRHYLKPKNKTGNDLSYIPFPKVIP